jgi:hypothetical protein
VQKDTLPVKINYNLIVEYSMAQPKISVSQIAQLSYAVKTQGLSEPIRHALIQIGVTPRAIRLTQQPSDCLQTLLDEKVRFDFWDEA